MVRLLVASLFWLAGAGGTAGAQPSATPEEATICLAIATHWTPRNNETRNIEAEPVAPSFRRIMEAGGCGRFSLVKQDLISWHLKFGSERSTTAALAYLEQELTSDATPPTGYLVALERAWRTALPDLRGAAATRQSEGANYSARHRVMERSATVARFQRLVYARGIYVDVAREYLRAGEEFASQPLLARADTLLAAAEAGAAFLQPLQDQTPASGLLHFNIDGVPENDFRLRIAVARAAATRSAPDTERAQALVTAAERPFYRQLAERAHSGGDGLCDISEGWSGAEELESTCRSADNIQEQLISYWMNRAMLDLLGGDARADSISLALRLLKEEERGDSGRCCWYSAREDLFRLHVARAEAAARAATTAGDPRGNARSDALVEALEEYGRAAILAPPDEAPRRFRQVAEGWIALWGIADAFVSQNRDADAAWPQRSRYAAYLRAVLEKLNEIAMGEATTR